MPVRSLVSRRLDAYPSAADPLWSTLSAVPRRRIISALNCPWFRGLSEFLKLRSFVVANSTGSPTKLGMCSVWTWWRNFKILIAGCIIQTPANSEPKRGLPWCTSEWRCSFARPARHFVTCIQIPGNHKVVECSNSLSEISFKMPEVVPSINIDRSHWTLHQGICYDLVCWWLRLNWTSAAFGSGSDEPNLM